MNDDRLMKFVNPDQPFGPIVAPNLADFQAFSSLFDDNNTTARELHNRLSTIIGRRGAGKTAFLHSLTLDSKFSVVVALQPGDAFPSMIRSIEQQLPCNILAEECARLWDNLLWGAVFKQLLTQHPTKGGSELLPVAQYLDGLGVTEPMNAYGVMRKILQAIATLNERLKILVEAIEELTSSGVTFREAKSCAQRFMSSKKIKAIILMDSLEQFPLDDDAMANTMIGLIHCVGQFNESNSPCEIRCCLPAELYPQLIKISSNPLKDFSRKIMIQWQSHELLHLAAIRYLNFIRLYFPDDYNNLFCKFDITNRQAVRGFWSHILPPSVHNAQGQEEDSIAYIMRHTQLLPRHLLLYLNEISRRSLGTNGGHFTLSEAAIVDGIHSSEHMLCKEIFSAFKQIYPKSELICSKLLSNLSLVFHIGELHKAFNRNRKNLDFIEDYLEALQMLLRIGVIGVVTDETDMYTKGMFDYTLPDNLNYRPDDRFCVHPIFSREYRVADHDDNRQLKPIYPSGSEIMIELEAA